MSIPDLSQYTIAGGNLVAPLADPREEWHDERRGKITASKFGVVMQIPKSKTALFSKVCDTYIYEKIAEFLTGQTHTITAAAFEWGITYEPFARKLYQETTGNTVPECAFLPYSIWVGGTPDGLIGDNGILEIKCPFNPLNHARVVMENKMPDEHIPQVQGNLMITGREWCDFVSYDTRVVLDDSLRIEIIRVYRDDKYITLLQSRIEMVIEKIKQLMNNLR